MKKEKFVDADLAIEQKAGDYAHIVDEETQSSLHPKTASFQGFYDGYNQGFEDGMNAANECVYNGWISIENEPKYFGRYLVKFDSGEVDVCWLSDKHGELNWYTHPECDIEFKIDGIKFYRSIDSL